MTKRQIIESIAREPKYFNMCVFITGKDADRFAQDLYQDIFVFLMDMPEAKLLQLYENNIDNYYFIMAARQYRSPSSQFYKLNVKPDKLFAGGCDGLPIVDSDTADDDDVIRLVERAMQEISFVDSRLLEILAERHTVRQVSEDSGIPIRSVYTIVQNARKNVIAKIKRYKREENG